MNVKNNKENMLNMSIYLGKVIVEWVKKCRNIFTCKVF